MIHPAQEMAIDQIQFTKDQTRAKLLSMALASKPGSKPSEWVFHETVFGDSSVTAPLFRDLNYLTSATTGNAQMIIDAADLTAGNLSSLLAVGEAINTSQFVGFYGMFDNSPEPGELAATADVPGNIGALVGIRFKRGGSTLDVWQCEHLYCYEDVVGITDRPVIYDQEEEIVIEACFTEDTIDKSVGIRGYTCEKRGKNFEPNTKHLTTMNGYFDNPLDAIRSGVNPAAEMTVEMVQDLKTRVIAQLFQMAIDSGVVANAEEALRKMYVRETWVGDESDRTDFVDIDQSATAQTTGQENWAQDATAITGGDNSDVFVAAEEVKKQKFHGIFGFMDKTANPDLMSMRFEDGGGPLAFFHVEHCYAYHGTPTGFFEQPLFYEEDSPIKWQIAVKAAADRFVGLRMLTLEKYGTQLSEN